jgi:hypothetical protein
VLVNYIKSFFEILISQLDSARAGSVTPSLQNGPDGYGYEEHEKLIQQLEADIRIHISQH